MRIRHGVTIAVMLLAGICAPAQTGPREFRFDVLSMKPMQGPSVMNTLPSPNGFVSRLSLWQMIMMAWGPGADFTLWGGTQVLNGPGWIGDFYDINARVSAADLKVWQNQTSEHELLRAALRTALRERCQLAIHEQPAEGRIFELVVARSGPRMKAAALHTVLPVGVKLAGGGVMVGTETGHGTLWTWHSGTMADLAHFLSSLSVSIPVRDRTGLTGRYDFPLEQAEILPDENPVYRFPVDRLGLTLRQGKEPRPVLVIDHLERPTPN